MLAQLHWICLGVGCWVTLNGILHSIAVIGQHKGEYNRDYLRLLMDGIILIACGGVQILSWKLIQDQNAFGFFIAGFASLMLLIYCMLIWPFLKSVFTILIESVLLILIIAGYFNL